MNAHILKKLLSILIAAAMPITLVSCADSGKKDTDVTSEVTKTTTAAEEVTTSPESSGEVSIYSYTETNSDGKTYLEIIYESGKP